MAKKVTNTSEKKIRPALTPEIQEQQCISLATNLAMKQLADGTASSQVIVHYLKLGTEKTKLENERLRTENELNRAKKEAIDSGKDIKVLYERAIVAMRDYAGYGREEEEDDY